MRGSNLSSDRGFSSLFAVLSAFVVVLALFSVALAAQPHPAAADEPVAAAAFPAEEGGWHTVTIDLGSSVLVRTYGRVLTAETPTDISVTMGETLSFVNAWIGDSKGDPVPADASDKDKYLVIEGTAANLAAANEAAIDELAYTLGGVRYVQFAEAPMRLAAATSADQDASGGCEAGLGVASLIAALAFAPLRARRRRR